MFEAWLERPAGGAGFLPEVEQVQARTEKSVDQSGFVDQREGVVPYSFPVLPRALTLRIASTSGAGRVPMELRKIAVTEAAMAAIAQTG
ncbi:hypothetical protein ACVWZ8_000252 [Arthrobacter sp. UYCu723]